MTEDKIKVKLTKEQLNIFYSIGIIVRDKDGGVYMGIPHWIKETDDSGVFEVYPVDALPEDLTEMIDPRVCESFQPSGKTSSYTECIFCGRESWEHGYTGK